MAKNPSQYDSHVKNREVAKKLAIKIREQVAKGASKGLEAALIFLVARVKEAASIPAPKKKVGKTWVATTRAIPGAPVRKLSGRLLQSIYGNMKTPYKAVIGANAKSNKNFPYPAFHEIKRGGKSGMHPFIMPTFEKYKKEIFTIMGKEIKLAFN